MADVATWRIEITAPNRRRETVEGNIIWFGDAGEVPQSAARAMCARGDAVRLDGCQAETADGSPCINDAAEDAEHCGVHADG